MILSNVVNLLVASELKPLSLSNIGGDYRDKIQDDNFRIIVDMINMAYSALYQKFALLQKEFVLTKIENNKTYILPSEFIYPITAGLRDGTQVSLNNEMKATVDNKDMNLSLMFPEPYLCLVKGEDPGKQTDISLIYCAEPEPVTDPHSNINLTKVFEPALMAYVGYRAFLGIDGNIEATNNTYFLRYISACKNIKIDGLATIDNLDSNSKLEERGWV